jgi:alkaline phosphatase
MARLPIALLLLLCSIVSHAQSIFAHNDYVKPDPFHKAFALKASYIEADIFLRNDKLLVAHTRIEIDPSKTLQTMYLDPISEKISKHQLYHLTLMIDLKTDGPSTLTALVKALEQYPSLTSSPDLSITVSGSYPAPSEWANYPAFIKFDGRPGIDYTPDQLKRVTLISTSFNGVSSWNGKGEIPGSDLQKIKKVIDQAHAFEKPVRFWAAPEGPNAWEKFIGIGIDVLNSDNIEQLAAFLEKR